MTNGVGKKIIDSNGNFILLEDGGWTDQLGRRTYINSTAALVTVKGYMGVPDRSISADFGTIGDAANLRDDYHSWPRPFTTGDARDVGGGEDSNYDPHMIDTPHTDLFLNSEGIRAYGTDNGFDVGTATALTRVNLPDGRSIRFRYNPWGEVAEIIYPGGGISQVDYDGHITNCEIHASFNVGRGVSERRTLKANGSVEGTWAYGPDAITINGVILPGVAVAVYQGTTTGTLLSSE
jgi:YD repeat-containing protein